MKKPALLIVSFLLLSSCAFYRVMPEKDYTLQTIVDFENDGKYLLLRWEDIAWRMIDLQVSNDTLHAKLDFYTDYLGNYLHPRKEGLNNFSRKNEPEVINSVHIFISEAGNARVGADIAIPLSTITQVQSYTYAKGASRALTAIAIIIPSVILVGGTILIVYASAVYVSYTVLIGAL